MPQSVSTSWSRKCCSSGVSFDAGVARRSLHAGRPPKSCASQPTVPASIASRSVCDIGGITLRKRISSGRLISARRRGGTTNGTTRIAPTARKATSQARKKLMWISVAMAAASATQREFVVELAGDAAHGRKRRRQAGEQERREPAQQDLVVRRLAGIELGDELERVGAGERVRQRTHDEVQPPRQLLARKVRQRARERGLVARDHFAVLLGEEAANERR